MIEKALTLSKTYISNSAAMVAARLPASDKFIIVYDEPEPELSMVVKYSLSKRAKQFS